MRSDFGFPPTRILAASLCRVEFTDCAEDVRSGPSGDGGEVLAPARDVMEEEDEPADLEAAGLVARLGEGDLEEKRAAVKQLRVMARGDEKCRGYVADAGGIEALLPLLRSADADMQENAITTLLNLSVDPQVRVRITQTQGALDGILELLSCGLSAAAKENAAATVFSLLIVEDYREEVGKHPLAIPALLELLRTAPTHRGRKDAIKVSSSGIFLCQLWSR
jgi:hypothetical protein